MKKYIRTIPKTEFKFSFSRSSGPGGQNVNKVNSKVQLEWHIESSSYISNGAKERFKSKYQRYLAGNDNVLITSQKFRSQGQNIEDCIKKLHQMLAEIANPPVKRKKTIPTRASIKKRLQVKKLKSIIKKQRSERY